MRQAGYLAAAGIYALDHHVNRLKDDHIRAKHLGAIISKLDYVENVLPVDTNIVIFNLNDKLAPEEFVKKLAAHNIKASGFGRQAVRFVTHLDFTDAMLEQTEAALKAI